MKASTRKSFPTLPLISALGATLVVGALPPYIAPLSRAALAFYAPTETVGPLTVSISGAAPVTQLETPMPLFAMISNGGKDALRGTLKLSVADDWKIVGAAQVPFSLAAGEKKEVPFSVVAGKTSLAALYPIHARAAFRVGASTRESVAEAIAIVPVVPAAVTAQSGLLQDAPLFSLPQNSTLRLDDAALFTTRIAPNGKATFAKPFGWTGVDPKTRADVHLVEVNRGGVRRALRVHPAWNDGWGDVFTDYRVTLPKSGPIALSFGTAIRDSAGNEPQSDGVEFRVLADDGGWKTLFKRFSAAKTWENATVDLSGYAGKTIALRLVTDPGPAHNTSVDQSYWADLTLRAGTPPLAETAAQKAARRSDALKAARSALNLSAGTAGGGKSEKDGATKEKVFAPPTGFIRGFAWPLQSDAANAGVAVVPGPNGLADAQIAFVEGERDLVFDGFQIEIDGVQVGGEGGLPVAKLAASSANGRTTLTQRVLAHGKEVPVRIELWAEKGALRVAFSMPGVTRDFRGTPRFTRLQIGPASQEARRVYAGFGNVIQDPGAFSLSGGGFTLSTRHSGFDFRNGMSLVQGTDIFPDSLEVDPARKVYAVRTHHDTTFTFVPSSKGAFAAARVFRGIANYSAGAGVKNILGRMALDQWDGDYAQAAQDLERAARYGLTDSVFVKHVWQRWGYDYRLPDIYPPSGDFSDFLKMVSAAKRNGILFAPHDNYIDFYPDATGFSYDKVLFNEDGTPQLAWLNVGPGAQSYRWLPTGFQGALDANLKKIKAGFAPTSYFVDVFSAIPPIDFYDRAGRFYPNTVSQERWGNAFDRIRAALGNDAPMISEAGTDALIGHLDAAQSDHAGWSPPDKSNSPFRWQMPAADAERVPWHDIVTHGKFVLFAGGLGWRYATGENDPASHGYDSDDYLSLTVLGGRNPMSAGPFSRGAVMTYWLLHDVSNQLAHREMLTHNFIGDDIHRQQSGFSGGARVLANRGKTDWTTGETVLPQYGFTAQAGDFSADVSRRGGVVSAMAQSPGVLFVDARPAQTEISGAGRIEPTVKSFQDLGGGKFRLTLNWKVAAPMARGYQPFVHLTDPAQSGDAILFQATSDLNPDALQTPGETVTNTIEGQIPEGLKQKSVAVRHGLFSDTGRWSPIALTDEVGRVRSGYIDIAGGENGAPLQLSYRPEPPGEFLAQRLARLNTENKILDFGAARTNGAFRLLHSSPSEWTLMPLPFSSAFEAQLQLDKLGGAGKRVAKIETLDESGKVVGAAKFAQDGNALRLSVGASVFAQHIRFAP